MSVAGRRRIPAVAMLSLLSLFPFRVYLAFLLLFLLDISFWDWQCLEPFP